MSHTHVEIPPTLAWLTDLLVDVEDAAMDVQHRADAHQLVSPAIAVLTRAKRRLVRAVAARTLEGA